MASPVNIISAALARPTARGRKYAPPSPGTMPILMKLEASFAPCAAMRMSHMQARSSPAPMAWPLIAAMVGSSQFHSASGMRWMPRM